MGEEKLSSNRWNGRGIQTVDLRGGEKPRTFRRGRRCGCRCGCTTIMNMFNRGICNPCAEEKHLFPQPRREKFKRRRS